MFMRANLRCRYGFLSPCANRPRHQLSAGQRLTKTRTRRVAERPRPSVQQCTAMKMSDLNGLGGPLLQTTPWITRPMSSGWETTA